MLLHILIRLKLYLIILASEESQKFNMTKYIIT